MKAVLGVLIALELALGVGLAGIRVADEGVNLTATDDDVAAPAQTPAPQEKLPPGQAKVTGVVTKLVSDHALLKDPLPLPFAIEVAQRGGSGARIVKALVARKPQTITWDGGRPLPIDGTGGLDLTEAGARLAVDANGVRWELDGAVRRFVPGNYRAKFTVAVGATGLGSVRDGVSFASDGNTLMETRGGAFISSPPRAVHIEGPGSVVITGSLDVRTSDGTRKTDGVGFGPGSYVIDLTPAPGGYSITATLQGPID